MITLKELKYVSSRPTRAPYPGVSYADNAALKLIESVDTYENLYQDKEYDLILSNGEQLAFEIEQMNLCHMLGIDYRYLTDERFTDFRRDILGLGPNLKSFEVLKAIIEHIDDVLEYDKNNSTRVLNYYRVMVKCSIFEKMSDFSKFNFGVINFDKDKYAENSNCVYHGNAEKFLYVQSNEQACPYFMMGILPSATAQQNKQLDAENNTKYAVETLFAPINVKDFFINQNVCIPTQILTTTTDEMIKKEATPSNKIALLNQYKAIVSEYGISNNMDIYSDYMATLSSLDIENSKTLIKK